MCTVESSILWSKSSLNARCRLCRRKGDGDKMLLCDMCDRGHHMYCLKPPVKVCRGQTSVVEINTLLLSNKIITASLLCYVLTINILNGVYANSILICLIIK